MSLLTTDPAAPAPDFELPDHLGSAFRLRDRLGGGGTVLVFFRGHWCPYCRRYLSKLQTHRPRFEARQVRLVAISPEPPATSRDLARELGLSFPLLCDADGAVIDRYGVRNGFAGTRALLPHAAAFVLDPAGLIRFKSIDRNYKKRTTVRTLFAALDQFV